MNLQFIFTSGIIVVILLLIGLIFTLREFKEMREHPEKYRNHNDDAFIDRDEKRR
jgi:uncharacterized membrane protein YqiK